MITQKKGTTNRKKKSIISQLDHIKKRNLKKETQSKTNKKKIKKNKACLTFPFFFYLILFFSILWKGGMKEVYVDDFKSYQPAGDVMCYGQ